MLSLELFRWDKNQILLPLDHPLGSICFTDIQVVGKPWLEKRADLAGKVGKPMLEGDRAMP